MIDAATYSDNEIIAPAPEDKREVHYEKNKPTSLKITCKN
jgi:hypothetical protein